MVEEYDNRKRGLEFEKRIIKYMESFGILWIKEYCRSKIKSNQALFAMERLQHKNSKQSLPSTDGLKNTFTSAQNAKNAYRLKRKSKRRDCLRKNPNEMDVHVDLVRAIAAFHDDHVQFAHVFYAELVISYRYSLQSFPA